MHIVSLVASVPIYDARLPIDSDESGSSSTNRNVAPGFTLTSHNIRRIPKRYATYSKGEEVPSGSLAMIGYTMGSYEKGDDTVLTPNLNWVVVLAADD